MKRSALHALALSLFLGLLMAACATGPRTRMNDSEFRRLIAEYNQELAPEDQIRCRKVVPIGSNIPEWECRTKWAQDAEALRQEDILRWMQTRPNTRAGN